MPWHAAAPYLCTVQLLLTSGNVVTAKYKFMPIRPDMALTSANATVTMVMTCRQRNRW